MGYPMLRAMGRTLRNRGIAFLDCTRVFENVPETLYLDACHFNEKGNLLLAEAIAKAFRSELPAVLPERPPRLLHEAVPKTR